MKQLESSLGWQEIEQELRTLGKSAPEFKFDIIKFCAGINSEVRKLAEVEVDYRRTRRDSYRIKHKDMCKKINEAINDFSKTHLMHLFTRVD